VGSRVELFEEIRRNRRSEGLSIRELAERHKVHRRAVRQARPPDLINPYTIPIDNVAEPRAPVVRPDDIPGLRMGGYRYA
jgi:hypothetical protein